MDMSKSFVLSLFFAVGIGATFCGMSRPTNGLSIEVLDENSDADVKNQSSQAVVPFVKPENDVKPVIMASPMHIELTPEQFNQLKLVMQAQEALRTQPHVTNVHSQPAHGQIGDLVSLEILKRLQEMNKESEDKKKKDAANKTWSGYFSALQADIVAMPASVARAGIKWTLGSVLTVFVVYGGIVYVLPIVVKLVPGKITEKIVVGLGHSFGKLLIAVVSGAGTGLKIAFNDLFTAIPSTEYIANYWMSFITPVVNATAGA